jgi:arylsulfatase A-like enzyme
MTNTEQNVVIAVLDTARAKEVYSSQVDTPRLDELAETGISFKNAYADAPWTLPSHGSLFTGCSPSKHGAHANNKYLDDHLRTLAESLRENGLDTLTVTNNAWVTDEFGFGRGFDSIFRTWQLVQTETDFGEIAMTTDGFDQFKQSAKSLLSKPLSNTINAIYGKLLYRRNDYGASRTNQIIKSQLKEVERPYFLFVNYLEPHLEYDPPASYARKYLPDSISYDDAQAVPQKPWKHLCQKKEMTDSDFDILQSLYSAEISYIDAQLGQVVDYLKKTGDWNDTIFIVLGDHGENIGDHGFMDHQYCLYDTLLHVPVIISGGAVESDSSRTDLIQVSDIYPTVLDLLDITDEQSEAQFQGQSAFSDNNRRGVISEYMAAQPSMDSLTAKVGDIPDPVYQLDRRLRAIRMNDYKLIRASDGEIELYDIENDPGEQTDLSDEHQDVVSELESELDDWLECFDQHTSSADPSVSDKTASRLEDLGYI